MRSAEGEAVLRRQLAAAYRMVDYFGWTELIYGHLTARVPGDKPHFLINPFGLNYDEVTASNLVKIDVDGNPIGESNHPVNYAGFIIHSAIHMAHQARHRAVMHTHTRAGMAGAATSEGLLPISMNATAFHGNLAYHDYEGIVISHDEKERLVRDLGDKDVMILRNHGLITCGTSVGAAYLRAYTLCAAAEMQSHACSMAFNKDGLLIPEDRFIKRTMDIVKDFDQGAFGILEFAAAMRELDYDQDHSAYPNYRN